MTSTTIPEVILVTSSYDHTIRYWEALSGICVRTLQHVDSQVNRLAISQDKRLLAAAGNPSVRLFDTNTGTQVSSFAHTANVTSVQFQATSRWIATSSEDSSIKIWDVRAPNVQRDYQLKCPVNDLLIHPNQGELISADSLGHIRVWDLGENSCSLELIPEQNTPIRTISMSADGATLVAANNKGNLYSWAVDSKTQEFHSMCTIKASAKYITRAVISPDMKSLATCSADHSVKMWNLPAKSLPGADITLDKVLSGAHQRWVWDCCFSADSAYLVTASSDHSAKLWDLASGEAIRNYAGHQKAVVCLALHDTLTT